MSFQKRRVTNGKSATGLKLGATPAIAYTDVKYTIDLLASADGTDCRTFVEHDIYQYLFDKYHRTKDFAPYVKIILEYDVSEHPEYKKGDEVVGATEFTLDFENSPVSFEELMAITGQLCVEHALSKEDVGYQIHHVTKYTMMVNYWLDGPSLDCYGDFPLLTTNMNHRIIFAKLKKALAKGSMI